MWSICYYKHRLGPALERQVSKIYQVYEINKKTSLCCVVDHLDRHVKQHCCPNFP